MKPLARIPQPQDDPCGWFDTQPAPKPARRIEELGRADAVVVGAGYTGLAVARRLGELRPEHRVVVLDAQRVGFGASGRNAGFVVDITDFAAAMEPDDTWRYVRTNRFGIERLREVTRALDIDCGWNEHGYLRAAGTEAGLRNLEEWPRHLERLGIGYQRLDTDETVAVTGSPYYRRALRLEGSLVVNPVPLIRGLAEGLPGSVELYEESPVRGIRPAAGGYEVEVGDGRLTTPHVFVTVNGYVTGLGLLRRQVVPLRTFASLTRVMTPDERQALGGQPEWGILAVDPGGSTVRRTADHRIFLRNYFAAPRFAAPGAGDGLRRKALALHREAFAARFPMLPEVTYDHTWSGVMGMSPGGAPFFGEVAPGMYASGGYNGAGIAMGTAAGTLLADLACGVESDALADIRGLPQPARLPVEPLRSLQKLRNSRRSNRSARKTL